MRAGEGASTHHFPFRANPYNHLPFWVPSLVNPRLPSTALNGPNSTPRHVGTPRMLSLFTLPPNSTQEALVPLAFCASTRTLANIVWSCLAPIIACAWVAIHPNVPNYPEVWWKSFRRRALIFFCALIAPEFTLWWALRQWKGAKSIHRQFEPFAGKSSLVPLVPLSLFFDRSLVP